MAVSRNKQEFERILHEQTMMAGFVSSIISMVVWLYWWTMFLFVFKERLIISSGIVYQCLLPQDPLYMPGSCHPIIHPIPVVIIALAKTYFFILLTPSVGFLVYRFIKYLSHRRLSNIETIDADSRPNIWKILRSEDPCNEVTAAHVGLVTGALGGGLWLVYWVSVYTFSLVLGYTITSDGIMPQSCYSLFKYHLAIPFLPLPSDGIVCFFIPSYNVLRDPIQIVVFWIARFGVFVPMAVLVWYISGYLGFERWRRRYSRVTQKPPRWRDFLIYRLRQIIRKPISNENSKT